jgi:hypothetical protein
LHSPPSSPRHCRVRSELSQAPVGKPAREWLARRLVYRHRSGLSKRARLSLIRNGRRRHCCRSSEREWAMQRRCCSLQPARHVGVMYDEYMLGVKDKRADVHVACTDQGQWNRRW